MSIFRDLARLFFEGVEKSTQICVEQLENFASFYQGDRYSPHSSRNRYRRIPDSGAYEYYYYTPPGEYSWRSPETWTLHEICERIWLQACLNTNEDEHFQHLQTFSMFQEDIADSADDPKWISFLDSLPGLRPYLMTLQSRDVSEMDGMED